MSSDKSESEDSISNQGEDKNIIDKILGQMKSEFNKTDKVGENDEVESEEAKTEPETPVKDVAEVEENSNENESEEKPRIILSFKKPSPESPVKTKDSNGRGKAQKLKANSDNEEVGLKRSARRRSKDCNESVLQSAIARKEKSYNESNKPQRLTRQLKPTLKILENIAFAKQEKSKCERKKSNDKMKNNDSDSFTETEDDKVTKKRKYKFSRNHKVKKVKSDSDSDQSLSEGKKGDEVFGKLNRVSTRDDSNTDVDDLSLPNDENDKVGECGVKSGQTKVCLCTEKTQYYLAVNDEEITYCAAVDNIDDKLIGCNRSINSKEVMLLRPSPRVPYTIFCDAHKNRLLRHNCCPTCGVFCTQGRFFQCEAKHHYHKDCQILAGNEQGCPHCGKSTDSYQVDITMHSAKRPIFLPVQRTHYVSARMVFPINVKHEDGRCVTPPLLPVGALDMQNSLDYGEEEYELSDLVSAINSNSAEKVAVILGSKSVDISCKISEYNDGTVLHLAVQKNQVSIVHMLLVAGAQSNALDKEQNTAVMTAVLSNSIEVLRYLIKTGASIDFKGTDGMTALHLAAKCGSLKACELLIKHAKGIKNFVNSRDDGGWTPLVWACEHGYADVANFLICKGADPFLRDVEHNVALHWAAFSGSAHIAELLLNRGCEVNAVNAHGDTPLHIGARQDMYDCIIVLLARGADVTLLNKNSESPLDCVPAGGDSYSPIALNITLQASVDCEGNKVILSNDISKGREINPIQCYNNVDTDPEPTDYQYITRSCIRSDAVKIETKINSLQYCQCGERCVTDECVCGKLSVRCWYDEEGKLIPEFSFNDIPMIFECNDRCACNAITCNNRVVQRGLTHRFELFKTGDRGWGVRTLRHIPRGSFVCEYMGEIVTDSEAERREDDAFLFDLENRVCGGEKEIETYCIDAKFYGNFTRFINHSCSPNLTPVKVFVEHQDLRFPRIAFFANRDVPGDEELSFDYGEKFWIAKYKILTCLCGSAECKYSEDTISMTMQNHRTSLQECSD